MTIDSPAVGVSPPDAPPRARPIVKCLAAGYNTCPRQEPCKGPCAIRQDDEVRAMLKKAALLKQAERARFEEDQRGGASGAQPSSGAGLPDGDAGSNPAAAPPVSQGLQTACGIAKRVKY